MHLCYRAGINEERDIDYIEMGQVQVIIEFLKPVQANKLSIFAKKILDRRSV
jgi:hypothetical protein